MTEERWRRFGWDGPTHLRVDNSEARGPNLFRRKPLITSIAAVAKNRVIGNGNKMPWHIPEDFKHFTKTTVGCAVIMGAATWDSLPEKFKPLPKRLNIVVSRRRTGGERPTAKWAGNLGHAIAIAKIAWKAAEAERAWKERIGPSDVLPLQEEIFIIGGASIYEQAMSLADHLVISEVELEPEGDVFFPEIGPEWTVSSRDQREGFCIVTYEKSLTVAIS